MGEDLRIRKIPPTIHDDFDIFLKKMTNYSIYGHNFKEKINEIQQLLNELKTVIND